MIVFVDNKRIEMEFKTRGRKVYIHIYSGSYDKTKERMQLCRQVNLYPWKD